VTDDVFIKPLDLSDFTPSPSTDSPGFTQLVSDVLGTAASPMDGFDAAIADASAIVDALDKALGEQDAALDAVLVTLDATNPASLDESMAGYAGTVTDSANIITDAQGLALPPLLELPIAATFGGGVGPPPQQRAVDLGTMKVGAAPKTYYLGFNDPEPNLTYGVLDIGLARGDPAIFQLLTTTRDVKRYVHHDIFDVTISTYNLQVTPAAEGVFVAQVNTVIHAVAADVITTYTVTVVP